MKQQDPSLFSRLVATVLVNAGQEDTERIGDLAYRYVNIEPSVKEVCRQIVFKEFDFKDEQFKEWHSDNVESFPTDCAEFVSYLIAFYEPNLKIDHHGFYIPTGVLNLSKKRLSSKDLWDYYNLFDNDRDIHPLATWKDAIISEA
jgi:hypothetical protein